MENTTKNKRLILAILAVVVGFFMMYVTPFIIQTSVERVMVELTKVSAEKPAYSSGILLFSFLFPIYRGFIFVAGVILILISSSIYKGKEWTYPTGLLVSAFPSAGGMFMMLPYVSFVDGFPLPIIISMVGLTFFWTLIFIRDVNKTQKWAQFLSMTFAGMLTTHTFTVGTGNLRMLLTRPDKPLYSGLETWVLAWSSPIQWISVILLFVSIYLLAGKKMAGWWIALIAGVTIIAIDLPTQVIRSLMTDATSVDYLIGSLLAAGLLFSILFPKFKKEIVSQPDLQES